MIADVAAWIFTLFVVDPFQAEMQKTLERANLPIEATISAVPDDASAAPHREGRKRARLGHCHGCRHLSWMDASATTA